ncbi:DHH family phosphoesterase [Candidatus Desantisbacteria bacterium]|nr:DHH family phosphoesterase [Candidatus Desantisbacteria bacterium]
MEIITSHQNIDFDGLASIIAAKKLYPKAKCILPNTIENNVHVFLKKYPEIKKKFSVLSPGNYKKINLLVLVDTQESKRLGDLSNILNNHLLKIHLYDHHPKEATAIKGELEICKNYGATITLLVEKLKEKNIFISPLEATLFILGIYEDTGSLTFISTTSEDI